MREVTKWGAVRMSRRSFLGRALAAIFGVFAGLSVGVPAVQASSCVGPYGTGYCGNALCSGTYNARCTSHQSGGSYTSCGYVAGFCSSTSACWGSGYSRCCDCSCYSNGYHWYCYCG